jgi:hypothetical protein
LANGDIIDLTINLYWLSLGLSGSPLL